MLSIVCIFSEIFCCITYTLKIAFFYFIESMLQYSFFLFLIIQVSCRNEWFHCIIVPLFMFICHIFFLLDLVICTTLLCQTRVFLFLQDLEICTTLFCQTRVLLFLQDLEICSTLLCQTRVFLFV